MKFRAMLTFLVGISTGHAADEVTARREDKQVVIRFGEKEILRYQAEPGELPPKDIPEIYLRGGYIRSIHTPSGLLVTDDYPATHLHHHGVWSPWTKTGFEGRHPDFWNMGEGTGTVEFVELDTVWEKDGKAGFSAWHRFVDLSIKPPVVAILERWDITAYPLDDNHVIDFTSTQTCATDSPLKLPEYRYGGFGFRGNGSWNGAENCLFLSASGLEDRNKVNTSREKWCWVGGKVEGKTCGVTFLDHPANFSFPQPIRAHPDEPFFCFAPQQLGDMEISPGREYISRYRMIVADGEPDAKLAAQWWNEYAKVR
jgi:hypothetical protein